MLTWKSWKLLNEILRGTKKEEVPISSMIFNGKDNGSKMYSGRI